MKKKLLLLSLFLVISLIAIRTLWNKPKDLQSNSLENNTSSDTKVEQNVSKDINTNETDEYIININKQFFYGHEPNLEFLINSSDLIVSGTIDTSSLDTEIKNDDIYILI